MLRKLLDRLSFPLLLCATVLLGLAPFQPEPHLVEKLRLLGHGQLTRPIDILDLLMHSAPGLLLLAKLYFTARPGSTGRTASGPTGKPD